LSSEPSPRRPLPSRADRVRTQLSRWLFSPLAGVSLGDWLRVLRQNGLHVPPSYWPRTALTSLGSPFNSLDAMLEERRFRSALAEVRVARPVFVLGHYRSGTTHLHNLLCADRRLTYTNNLRATFPLSFLRTETAKRRWGALLAMRSRPQDDVELDLKVPGEDELALCGDCQLSTHMAWHFPHRAEFYERYLTFRRASSQERETWKASLERFSRKLTFRADGRTIVLKSPTHTGKVSMILETFPDARFVHIDRDPFTLYSSTMKMERTVPPHFTYQHRDPTVVSETVLRRLAEMYEAYLEDRESIPEGQLHEVSFTKLEADPVGTLAATYAALDLPDFERGRPALEAYVASLSTYKKNRYDDLEPALRRTVRERWAPYFEAFGYE
jgi:hypothetical protein